MPAKKRWLPMEEHRMSRVDLILMRYNQIQDLELKILQYRSDVAGLRVGLTDKEIAELFRRQHPQYKYKEEQQ